MAESPQVDRGRVLLVHRFYAPDVPTYAHMLRTMADQLSSTGFDVTVFSTQPSYNSVYEGDPLPRIADEDDVRVLRNSIPGGGSSIGRLGGGLVFGVMLLVHCLRNRSSYDAISVSTVPPVAMGLFGTIAARIAGARLVYHCMDLYPEIAIASGLANDGPSTRLARRLDMLTIGSADAVVVLSEDMARTLRKRGHSNDNVVVLNNFATEHASAAADLPAEFVRDNDTFRIIFAGNLGRFQGLDTIMSGFLRAHASDPALELCLLGAGVMEDELREIAGSHVGRAVKFWRHRPLPEAMAAIAEADLAIVSLVPDLIGSAYPSKTIMYLEMGTRVLAVVEPDSELAQLVEEERLGTTVEPGDVDEFAAALLREHERSRAGEADSDSDRARKVARNRFSQDMVLPKWTDLYKRVIADRRESIGAAS